MLDKSHKTLGELIRDARVNAKKGLREFARELDINPATQGEIEDIVAFELEKAKLMPTLEDPVVNLEAFVEEYLEAHFDQHATLGRTVLGETEFRVGAPPKVSINKDLTDAAMDDDFSEPGLL